MRLAAKKVKWLKLHPAIMSHRTGLVAGGGVSHQNGLDYNAEDHLVLECFAKAPVQWHGGLL